MKESKSKASSVWGVKCKVKSCGITKRHCPEAQFYRFPKQGTSLYNQWIKACGITEELGTKKNYVCDIHFPGKERLRGKMRREAVPTLNLTANSNDTISQDQTQIVYQIKSEINPATDDDNESNKSIKSNKNENFQDQKEGSVDSAEDSNDNLHSENENVLEVMETTDDKENQLTNSNENKNYKVEQTIGENTVKIVVLHNNVPAVDLCIFKKIYQNNDTKEVSTQTNSQIDQNKDVEKNNGNEKNDFKNKTIANYNKAIKYLKPLEEFTLLNEDLRAVGLINQLEIYFKAKLTHQLKN